MNAGTRIAKLTGIVVLCLGSLSFADTPQTQPAQSNHPAQANQPAQSNPPVHKKSSKKAEKSDKSELPPLPSGPTGKPVPQISLDSIAAVAPQVSYQSGQLTINAPNSTLGDILRAVRKQTGADIDVPEARERVVTHLGPGPARQVIAELLNGSRFNYVMLGSPTDSTVLTRIVLVAKTPEPAGQNNAPGQQQAAAGQPGMVAASPEPADASADAEPETPPEENAEENNQEQSAAEAEQPTANPDQNGVKTPQQLLQEMQQRQLQMQQQMQQQIQQGQPGQTPAPPTPRNPQQNE
jgi:hypothetical protein